MNLPKITCCIKKATAQDLLSNLKECDLDFQPPLSSRVSIEEYATKLYNNSITFEAWDNDKLIGMIAVYLNDVRGSIGYISNVCVEDKYKGYNIASNLMIMCIDYAKKNKFKNIILEVNEKSKAAIHLYNKFNFKSMSINNEIIKMLLEIDQYDIAINEFNL